MSHTISQAVILAAGLGSRLRKDQKDYLKPLYPLCGRPLVSYVMQGLSAAGVRQLHVVVGYEKDELIRGLEAALPPACGLETIDNPDFRLSNGISLLKAKGRIRGRFLLSMADHLFAPALIERLLQGSTDPESLYLGVDRKLDAIFDMDDATKVRCAGDRIRDIDKTLTDYQAVDTGLFVCPDTVFDYLDAAARDQGGDCSLSDGVRRMASDDRARVVDVGGAFWQDVDTPAMYRHAEDWLKRNGAALGMGPVGGTESAE